MDRNTPVYLRLQHIADKYLPKVENAYYKGLTKFRKTIDINSLTTTGDIRKFDSYINWNLLEKFLEPVYDLLAYCIVEALTVASRETVVKALDPSFDMRNRQAIRWAQKYAGQEIVEVRATTQRAVAKLVSNALQYGGHPYEVARNIRQHIGLTDFQIQSVSNYQAQLDESGRTKRDIDRMVDSYIRKKIRQRANTIARTETIKAANMGQQIHWDDMIGKGLLDKSTNVKVWIATKGDRTCPTCMALDGKTTEIQGSFSFEGFNGLTPPIHPLCRCSIGIQEREPLTDEEMMTQYNDRDWSKIEKSICDKDSNMIYNISMDHIRVLQSIYNVTVNKFELGILDDDTWAETDSEESTITFNSLYFQSLTEIEESIQESIEASWHPNIDYGEGLLSIITHEYGHIIWTQRIEGTIYEKKANTIWNTASKNPAKFAQDLSIYGTKTLHEMFCEGLAQVLHSSYPSKLSQRIGDLIKEACLNEKTST